MKNTGKLIIFSAPSGSGKTTLVRYLLGQNLDLEFSISATSRKPRGNEKNGVDYYFLEEQEFRKKVDAEEFLEWEEVYKGALYGTLKSEVERIWAEGKNVIFDMDVIGGLNLKSIYKEKALSVFVKPPSMEHLEDRLRSRKTDSEEKIKERLAKADREFQYAREFDCILINNELSIAKKEAKNLVEIFTGK